MKSNFHIRMAPLAVVLVALAGCGNTGDNETATQVAAKVNSTEITISQVNNALAKAANVNPEAAPRLKREILDNLIDSELAKQKAIEQKLDRLPEVLQSLEAAKTEILARAYVTKITTAQARPTPDEIKTYYNANPALFAQRRVYSLEEISLPAQAGLADLLRQQATRARSMQDISAWLKAKDIAFTANNGVRASEQLPFEYLEKMATMKDGESAVFELRGGIQVIRIGASRAAPVNEATAAPRIHQYLFNQRSSAAVTEDMKAAKETAKIEYVGEFAISTAQAEATIKAQREAKSKSEAAAKAQAEADAIDQAEIRARAAVEAREKSDAISKARIEAELARRSSAAQSPSGSQKQIPTETIDKGVRGL